MNSLTSLVYKESQRNKNTRPPLELGGGKRGAGLDKSAYAKG
ncbi:MAG TPA: hypothetical protein VJY15_12340 [Candidatus Acidoferrum sp.]|nr:hypothetical protein [Candidatus Acidoferrum sp.]